ncbi:MAG: AEC family transporter [Leptothrix sp. (in: b-proteobacteria)]
MLTHALLLLPDFLLIVIGFCVCRYTALDRSVWSGAERLVYWMLFPALLFTSIVKSPLAPLATLSLAGGGVLVVGLGFVLTVLLRSAPGVDARLLASGAQTAFRFNSYVGLALADRLGGAPYVAWMALLLAICVPLCNLGAVWSLARHGGHHTGRELLRNPLIVATVAGLIANQTGLHLPGAIDVTLTRISAAALPLGLLAVGAGLQFGGLQKAPGLAALLMSIRHAVLPLAALGACVGLGLPIGQAQVLVAFAALPTASSAYVLAARMGGDGPYVAGLVTASTLLAMVSVPLAMAAFAWLMGG